MKQEFHDYNLAINDYDFYKSNIFNNNEYSHKIILDALYYKKNCKYLQSIRVENNILKLSLNDAELINIIEQRLNSGNYEENKSFFQNNSLFLSGYITYSLHNYNLYIASLILILFDVFDIKDSFIIKQHVDFILRQKRKDGKIGFLNPLIKLDDFDYDYFFNINDLVYKIIKKIYQGDSI